MRHLTQDELLLLFYRELSDADRQSAEEHLQSCDACRQELAALEQTLRLVESLPVPERGDDYGREVWARIGPRLVE